MSSADPFAPSLDQLRQRTSEKWRRYPADVLPLWVAEMDVTLAAPVVEALVAAARAGDLGYPAPTRYLEALASFAARHWGWELDVSRAQAVGNVMGGVSAAVSVLTEPGDTVVVNCPVYPPFYSYVARAGRVVAEAPLSAAGRLDLEALDTAFAQARERSTHPAYLLCSPHNPTGTLHRPDELAAVADLARHHGLRVISDEIHAPLVLEGTFTPLLSLEAGRDAVALLSASKAFNLAGAPGAVLVAGPEAGDLRTRLATRSVPGASHLGVIAQTAALREGDAWLDTVRAQLLARRDHLVERLATWLPDVHYAPGSATYLAWLDARDLHLTTPLVDTPAELDGLTGPAAWLLANARVALSDGAAFGSGGVGHVRLNFATSTEILDEALTRIAEALNANRESPGFAAAPRPPHRAR